MNIIRGGKETIYFIIKSVIILQLLKGKKKNCLYRLLAVVVTWDRGSKWKEWKRLTFVERKRKKKNADNMNKCSHYMAVEREKNSNLNRSLKTWNDIVNCCVAEKKYGKIQNVMILSHVSSLLSHENTETTHKTERVEFDKNFRT